MPRAWSARSTPRARRSARHGYAFGPQDRETEAAFDLPVELRNDIARLEISGERSAGAVQLLDKRWRRRAIGVVTGATSDTAQPLLASTFYLTRALSPFADVRLGDRGAPQQVIAQFLDQRLPMIVLADVGTLSPEIRERLNAWIEQGGVLVRFAGPRLAQADDDLVPVKLRRGGRSLGGSLTWEKPQHLASFAADGPFAGLAVPKDITINRQVLAEPDAVLATKSWASLEDGTPLVTGEHRGKGVVSLFHVGADCAGRTCRCPAPSSKCCGGWSTCPATPPSPARVSPAKRRMSKPWRRCARSTVSARSARRLRPPSRCRPTIATAPPRIIRRASTAPPKARSPSIRWPRPIASRRSIPRRLRAQHATYTNAEPRDLRGILLSSSLALFLIDAIVVAMLGARPCRAAGGGAPQRRRSRWRWSSPPPDRAVSRRAPTQQ